MTVTVGLLAKLLSPISMTFVQEHSLMLYLSSWRATLSPRRQSSVFWWLAPLSTEKYRKMWINYSNIKCQFIL